MLRSNAQSTPLISDTQHYYVTLKDVSINGRRLNLRADDPTADNCLIDSGSSVSWLARPVHAAVKKELEDYFSAFGVASEG